MKGKEKNQLKSQKGITLIALVITIVVLLILAGVTLSIVFNGGIIDKSQQAVDTYSEESAKEKLSLALFDYKMGYITGGEKDLKVYLESNGVGTVIEGTTEYTVEVDGYEFIVKKENLEIISNGKVNTPKPNISIAKVVSDDKKSATIKVTATATNGGALKVTIGEKEVTIENGTYNLAVIKNGTYTVIVEETGLTRKAIRSVSVTEIETTEIISNGNNINGNTNGTLTGLAYNYYNPVIPVGFKTSNEGASWADANNDGIIDGWNDGLVITDAETDGNQFVWVPVDGTNVIYGYHYSIGSTGSTSCEQSLPTGITSENTQITKYGGFYIARYEAGIPTDGALASTNARNVSGIPVSKKNQVPWNYISWSQSKANATSMYTLANTNNHVQSGLITDRMWETTMQWLENANPSVNVTSDSREWGNYTNAPVNGITEYSTNYGTSWIQKTDSSAKGTSTKWLLKTGHTSYTSINNIYDLAGNLWEWTNAKYSSDSSYYVARGGGNDSDGTSRPAALRGYDPDSSDQNNGFRVVLFVQQH